MKRFILLEITLLYYTYSVIIVGCDFLSPTERTRVIVDLDCTLGCGAKVPSLLVLVINA